jgi:hypothetical protein
MEKDIMIKDFNVSEKGHGSYWLLGILRWVMVLIFIGSGANVVGNGCGAIPVT